MEFDFEAAQRELTLAERVVGDDFFLGEFREEFLDNARYLISEAYCRIHQRIDIGYVRAILIAPYDLTFRLSDLSERLNLSKDEGEKWIVNLIRETRMGADAKIDLEKVPFPCLAVPPPLLTRRFSRRTLSRFTAHLSRSTNPSSKRPAVWRSAHRLWEQLWPDQAGCSRGRSRSRKLSRGLDKTRIDVL